METSDGKIYRKGNDFPKDKVVRVSFLPNNIIFPRHDVVFVGADFKYEKRYCRATMTWSSKVKEYLHCVKTDKFTFNLRSSNGQVILTKPDYELRF